MVETESESWWPVETHQCELCLCLCSQWIDQVCNNQLPRFQADRVCSKLEHSHALSSARVVVDSAFGLQSKNFLIKSGQKDPILRLTTTRTEDARAMLSTRWATPLRQLSECRMRMIQGQFLRLKDNFQLEDFGEQNFESHLIVSPHNCRALKVGINQILSALMSKTEGFCSCVMLKDAINCFNQQFK